MGDWQTIDSAPKDGTPVLLLCSKFAGEIAGVHNALDYLRAVEVGSFRDGKSDYPGNNWWCLGGDYYACWGWPTHWQPLPSPPVEA